MRICVIGGGINGSGIGWELVRRGYDVTLLDKGEPGSATSSATTKMIHGGLRYLEHLHFGLVHESLRERGALLRDLPDLVHPLELIIPSWQGAGRPRWMVRLGLTLYDLLAGERVIRRHRALAVDEVLAAAPLRRERLSGGFSYFDAQVDDHALAARVVQCAIRDGMELRAHTEVDGLERNGPGWVVRTGIESIDADLVVNAVGPWMNQFLDRMEIRSRYRLTLVRGSHLVLRRRVSEKGVLLQSPDDQRILFVLPWKSSTLVGTTEVVQSEPSDGVQPSAEEIGYLIERFNRFFVEPIGRSDIASTFAGVRPLVGRRSSPSSISREFRIERQQRMVNVFGGKMTTFLSLARQVGDLVDDMAGQHNAVRPADFRADEGADE